MENNNSFQEFKNLEIPIPKMKPWQKLGEWYIVNGITYPITKFVATNRFTLFFIKRAHSFLNILLVSNSRLKNYYKSIARLKNEKNNNKIDGYSNDSDYGYSGDVFLNELMTMYKYKKMIDEQYPTPNESKETYKHIIEKSSVLIEQIKPSCYLNFGVCYAYTDSILAKKYPDVQFIGTERTDSAKLFNGLFFSDIPNLTMLSGDIFDTLKNGNFKGGIFMHSRTLLLLPQTFVRDLYKAVHDAGFSHILATEQYGVSRQLGKAYKFSYNYQDSAVYRDFMYIHNYPNILTDCGFKLNRIENFKTDHWHEDVRILSFEAERID
jgi:hypothetical protein